MRTIHYRAADVNDLKISYREAGRTEAPTVLLLHGFPSAGHMFRDLIPLLADRYHLIAPDLPGFGQSDLPPCHAFKYTFENLTQAIDRFTDRIGLKRFALYVFDYGVPVGYRTTYDASARTPAPEHATGMEQQTSHGRDQRGIPWTTPFPME
jgi:pimeloyl-ACP methyl ester carboxylesterase